MSGQPEAISALRYPDCNQASKYRCEAGGEDVSVIVCAEETRIYLQHFLDRGKVMPVYTQA